MGIAVQPEPSGLCLSRQFFFDLSAAVRRADDDAIGGQFFFVLRKGPHANGFCTQEAAASCRVSRGYPRTRELQDFAAQEGQHPANGTNEARTVQAGPGHRSWPGQIVDGARQDVGEDLLGGATATDLLRCQVLALGSGDYEHLVERYAWLFGEAHRGAW